MNNLIAIKNVKKALSGQLVLDVSEFVINSGECVVIRGSNGAGKSTLFKILAGLLTPDQGTVILDGVEMSFRHAYRKFRKDVVYLHQMPYLFDRSVSANVAYGLEVRKMGAIDIKKKVSEALEWAGLIHLAERNARNLSGGEKQRIALTRARILAPKLLLLDEPTSGMDRESKQQTFELIRDLADSGNAVYIATHESVDLYHPDRVIGMAKGQLLLAA